MINSIFNPYARGIVRIAPIREDLDTTNLTPGNINIGKYTEVDPSTSGPGTYYVFNEEYQRYDPVVLNWEETPNYDTLIKYYSYDITDSNLLEPLRDIVDICGTNPSEIKYSKNTSSSEESGRTQGSTASGVFLNMHKDILGRVRDVEMSFPPIFIEKYSALDNLFMNKTQIVKTSQETTTEDPNETTETETEQYVMWYYVELLLPETGGVVKDIYYVGDSSFTSVTIEYRNIVSASDRSGNATKIDAKPFAKGLKINLIGKCAINGIANI